MSVVIPVCSLGRTPALEARVPRDELGLLVVCDHADVIGPKILPSITISMRIRSQRIDESKDSPVALTLLHEHGFYPFINPLNLINYEKNSPAD